MVTYPNIGDGIRFTGASAGSWMTGDQLLQHIQGLLDKKASVKSTEALASAIGKKFGEEHVANRKEIAALRAEVEALRKQVADCEHRLAFVIAPASDERRLPQ